LEAVLAVLRREEPVAVAARRFGISENSLYRLRDRFLEGGKAALADGKEMPACAIPA
jgi:transposase-like protein